MQRVVIVSKCLHCGSRCEVIGTMRLRAVVRELSGKTVHLAGAERTVLPAPVTVEIEQEPSGCLLLRLDATGTCIADTWHRTTEEAKSQAAMEYRIDPDDWTVVA
jgi:hypothetical protein